MEKKYRITARVIDRQTSSGVPELRVEAWDKDLIFDDSLSSAVTDSQGAFQFEFDESYFTELFLDRRPDLFFKVYHEDKLIKSTEDSIIWNVKPGDTELVINVDAPTSSSPLVWRGKYEFWLTGTDHHEDTLWIEANYKNTEQPLRLTLPTLCITYADMGFANAIGGVQKNYPESSEYGPMFFNPQIEISGEKEIEKFTWIRGAHRVVIAPETTEIEWYRWNHLVIPRLRLPKKKPVIALLTIEDTRIAVDEPLAIKVKQYADGRQIGSIRVGKRHPDWQPKEIKKEYDLRIWVVDGKTLKPMPEVALNLFRWDPELATPYGKGGFRMIERRYSDGHGTVQDLNRRPSNELEAITLHHPGWRAVARCFRPLPGQPVQILMLAWKLKEDFVRYIWKTSDRLEVLGELTGYTIEDIRQRSKLSIPLDLRVGMRIKLPCYAATYRMEPCDTFEWLSEVFAYPGVEELTRLNGLDDPADLSGLGEIKLPGWHFFYARRGDSLERIDKMFGLPPGSSRTVGRVHHQDPRLPYESETIAVPTEKFVEVYIKR
jgi:hypothetical protein